MRFISDSFIFNSNQNSTKQLKKKTTITTILDIEKHKSKSNKFSDEFLWEELTQ